MPEVKRQLAAIMFTDMVGYTSLMAKDESAALALLRYNRQIHIDKLGKYDGKLLKEMGDGTLSSFTTISEAILCAIDIQRAASENSDLRLRIGIHVGEVVVEEGDVFGGGVNIASRIESLAVPDSILVSEQVYHEVKNNKDILVKQIGKFKLKNIEKLMEIYAIANQGIHVPSKQDIEMQSIHALGSGITLKITSRLMLIVLIVIGIAIFGYFLLAGMGKL
jgi:class 3 adenylate cyclase